MISFKVVVLALFFSSRQRVAGSYGNGLRPSVRPSVRPFVLPSHRLLNKITRELFELGWQNLVCGCTSMSSRMSSNLGDLDPLFKVVQAQTCIFTYVSSEQNNSKTIRARMTKFGVWVHLNEFSDEF